MIYDSENFLNYKEMRYINGKFYYSPIQDKNFSSLYPRFCYVLKNLYCIQ